MRVVVKSKSWVPERFVSVFWFWVEHELQSEDAIFQCKGLCLDSQNVGCWTDCTLMD